MVPLPVLEVGWGKVRGEAAVVLLATASLTRHGAVLIRSWRTSGCTLTPFPNRLATSLHVWAA